MARKTEPYKGKILVINDEPAIRDGLVRWLVRTGYHYALVDRAHEAEALLEHARFDTIVHSHEFLLPPWSLSHNEISS